MQFVCLHDDRKSPLSTAVWPSMNPSDPYWKEAAQYIQTATGQSCLRTGNFLIITNIHSLQSFVYIVSVCCFVFCMFICLLLFYLLEYKFGSYFSIIACAVIGFIVIFTMQNAKNVVSCFGSLGKFS